AKKEAPPPDPAPATPEPELPKAPPPAPAPKPADPAREAALALEAFRASLPTDDESELVGEIPWGTWRPDLHHAPGGEARFDPAARAVVLTARGEGDRVWIKRPFAGAKSGY